LAKAQTPSVQWKKPSCITISIKDNIYCKKDTSRYPKSYPRQLLLYKKEQHMDTFSEALVFLAEIVKQHAHCVVPTHYPQNQQLAQSAKYLRCESHKLFTTGTSKVKLEKAMELGSGV
jgi:hypothetical protein